MKKNILVLLVAITMGLSAVAQRFEVIWETAFDNYFEYYEEWPDDMGYGPPGIYYLRKIKGRLLTPSFRATAYGKQLFPLQPAI